ncbi:MAG: MBL fold metallo-hydrolase [Deltaproteobacteria bacterium]|nr:MBL fold metallo-hydrolase [Deltaproteobacteria bacterium]
MKLTVLGSGTGTPNPLRAAPSILLDLAGSYLLLDCGPAALNRLTGLGLNHRSIDAVFISHFHLDHTLDLWAFLFTATYPDFNRSRPVQIFAPPGFDRLHQALLAAYGPEVNPPAEAIETIILDPARSPSWLESSCLPGIVISAKPVNHRPESIAFRLETDELGLVYSGDTGWSDGLVEFSRGVDWLILEATRPDDDPVAGHLTPSEAGRLAQQAGAKRLLLTHLSTKHGRSDPAEAARIKFNGPVITATDGLVLDLLDDGQVARSSSTGRRADQPVCH